VTTVDNRKDYGETIKITIGRIDKRICVTVNAERDDTIRIISARKANARERRKYYECSEGTANEEA
jgi:uncharacterized protein